MALRTITIVVLIALVTNCGDPARTVVEPCDDPALFFAVDGEPEFWTHVDGHHAFLVAWNVAHSAVAQVAYELEVCSRCLGGGQWVDLTVARYVRHADDGSSIVLDDPWLLGRAELDRLSGCGLFDLGPPLSVPTRYLCGNSVVFACIHGDAQPIGQLVDTDQCEMATWMLMISEPCDQPL